MFVKIFCSNCGKSYRMSTKNVVCVRDAINAGWGSCGSALYCPKCSKTWHERNKKPMSDGENTAWRISTAIADAICGLTHTK